MRESREMTKITKYSNRGKSKAPNHQKRKATHNIQKSTNSEIRYHVKKHVTTKKNTSQKKSKAAIKNNTWIFTEVREGMGIGIPLSSSFGNIWAFFRFKIFKFGQFWERLLKKFRWWIGAP